MKAKILNIELATRHLIEQHLIDLIKRGLRKMASCSDAEFNKFPYEVVLMAAHFVGTNPKRLAELTGYPPRFIRKIDKCMRDAGIWKGDRADTTEWRHWTGFRLHVLVAAGRIVVLSGSEPRRYGARTTK